jgi:hypothetical protein
MPERDAPSDSDAVRDAAPAPGRGIIRASWAGTIAFSVSAVATAVAPHTFVAVGVGVSLLLFFVGIGLFLWAYAVAVNRSRTDLIGLGGLFFLVGSAPRGVQRSLLGSFGVEIVVGLVTAAIHPFTPLAFGVLAPMYGLALCGLWAAKWGTFPPRPPDEGRRKGRSTATSGGSKSKSTAKAGSSARGSSGRTTAKNGRATPPKGRSSRSR